MFATIVGLAIAVAGAVCVNRARTPDGAYLGMALFAVGVGIALISAASWWLG